MVTGTDVGLVKLPAVKCTLLLMVGAMGCILMGQYWLKQFPHLSLLLPNIGVA